MSTRDKAKGIRAVLLHVENDSLVCRAVDDTSDYIEYSVELYKTEENDVVFCDEKDKNGKNKFGAIGGHTSISFTPTGLGKTIICECHGCKASINITNFDSW